MRPTDLSMNLPPETDDPELIARMQAGVDEVMRDIVPPRLSLRGPRLGPTIGYATLYNPRDSAHRMKFSLATARIS